ncbi:MAG: hypothetical protein ABUL64_02640, partial [Singulisphaera sp.]
DPHVREEVWQLERSWQMLDELPRTQVDESFTRSTVEMIALRAEEDLVAVQSEIPRRKRRLAIVAGGLLLVAAAAGFLTIKTLNRRGEESMLRDLPVAEDLDQYRVIQDVEFLRALHSRGFQPTEARHEG